MQFSDRVKVKLIGDRAFYKKVFRIFLPAVVHVSVTNFVNFLDNLMIGKLGTAQMSGVGVSNQLLLVFNMIIFGVLSAAGIFSVQFFGSQDFSGVRKVFRAKIYMGVVTTVLGIALFLTADEALLSLFLQGEGSKELAESILANAKTYLHIMLFGLPAFVLSQSISTTMRESGEMKVPMQAGVAALLTNLTGNYLLIFGNLGFPKLGLIGAAIATALSRYVELGIISYAAKYNDKFRFFKGVFRSFSVPASLWKDIFIKGAPLMLNEILWSLSMSAVNQIYSRRALKVLAAINISSSVVGMFTVVLIASGTAVAVIIGHLLGAGKTEQAKKEAWQLMSFSFFACALLGALLYFLAPLFPKMFNTQDEIRQTAVSFMRTFSIVLPVKAATNCSYYTLRAGGKTVITFLFDSAFNWVVLIPLAYALVEYTSLPIEELYFWVQAATLLKLLLGLVLVQRGTWVHNLVKA
ncbi:MAG: MATE family efflux transporter [Eubacteriales bacterium]|nr:MATE family efflux transporter [Eubacteriales bacterium]